MYMPAPAAKKATSKKNKQFHLNGSIPEAELQVQKLPLKYTPKQLYINPLCVHQMPL